ncbi:MAG: hypothetical protein K9G76_03460 [Bacteroidales bacterium]|nr:hypothetical protein [Bacteroidales bacterium]MCF8402851.1 hypothetical protein [Bacteroidales bacterium]
MLGFGLYTNKGIKRDKKLRWRNYFIDFTLTNKYYPQLIGNINNWSNPFPFNQANRNSVPPSPGIYIFFVKPNLQIHPEQSFIMYVGYSMNLYNRYGDYLTTYKNSDEPNYFERRLMLNAWESVLQYSFLDLAGYTEKQITKLETKIIDALVPPINRDFAHATIKQQVRLNR